MIVFVSLPCFYLQGEKSIDRGALVRDKAVLEASAGVVKLGVRVGDSVRLAKRRCPGLEVVEFRAENYVERFEKVWSIVAEFTPSVETTDLHQGYLDITKDAKRYGEAERLVSEMQCRLKTATGLRIEWGGGTDKWMAWLARSHNQFITHQMESLVLSKLSIEAMALPERIVERLHNFDIHTLADLLCMPAGFLESHLGFDREFVIRRLSRHKERVRANFPPPQLCASIDIADQDDFVIERAVSDISKNMAEQLATTQMQATILRLRLITKTTQFEKEIKLVNISLTNTRIERTIWAELLANSRVSLRHIRLTACGLLPTVQRQDTLWGEHGKLLQENAVEKARLRLQSKYGTQSLMSGSAALVKQTPRFAQLIYQSRGLSLP